MKKYHFCCLLLATLLALSLLTTPAAALEDPQPLARAAILVDGIHGDVVYEHNAHERMYPASITKIMTSLLVLEAIEEGRLSLDTQVAASAASVAMPEDSSNVGIQAGEILTVEQLLYCDMVASANEACNILAETVAGSIPDFVDRMNERAAELGMTGTHFTNPHGLHNENHYTTAYDITIMARAAMKHALFRTLVSTAHYTVPATNLSKERKLHSTNALISNWYYLSYLYNKALGIKTGTTEAAGKCLASAAADEQGRIYYCVILGAQPAQREDGTAIQTQFSESRRLLEWAFDSFERRVLLDDTSYITELPVTLSDEAQHVVVQPRGSIEATMPVDYDPAKETITIQLPEQVEAPVTQGQVLGSISLRYDGVEYGSLELVAADSVARSSLQFYLQLTRHYLSQWWVKGLLAGAGLLLLVLVVQRVLFRPRHYTSSGSRYKGRRR